MQENVFICYKACKLKEHEHNYTMHDMELATIVHALKMWRHYLLGRKFELWKDHMTLKYLFE
jgi:nucleoside phosphorylase